MDISIGEIALNLNEELILGKKSSDTEVDQVLQSSTEYNIAKKKQNKQAPLFAITKYTSFIPEKVCQFCIRYLYSLVILLWLLPDPLWVLLKLTKSFYLFDRFASLCQS